MAHTAVIAGVGPGLGESLARKFAAEGCQVALFARSADYINDLAADLPDPGEGLAVQTDLTGVDQIRDGFEVVRDAFGPVDILVNHASAASWKGLMDVDVAEFERAWAVNGRGAFVCSQEAVGDMLETGGGTVIFTGATSAVRSLGGAIGFTAAKFAARGMAMDIAQEFGPEGVHVAAVLFGCDIRRADLLVEILLYGINGFQPLEEDAERIHLRLLAHLREVAGVPSPEPELLELPPGQIV